MRKIITKKVALITLLTGPASLAHEGHGLEGVAHVMVHSIWILGAVLAVAASLHYLPRVVRQKQRGKR